MLAPSHGNILLPELGDNIRTVWTSLGHTLSHSEDETLTCRYWHHLVALYKVSKELTKSLVGKDVQHVQYQTGETPTTCTTCPIPDRGNSNHMYNMSSTRQGKLQPHVQHVQYQTGETPTTCTTCPPDNRKLQPHVQHVQHQTGETPTTCTAGPAQGYTVLSAIG
jgi:hypothetical protein